MGNRYAILKQLIDFWEAYENEEEQLNLLDFSEWLTIQLKQKPELNKKSGYRKLSMENAIPSTYFKNLNEYGRFLESISRISRFHEFYTRKFLIDLPINTRLEYLFLETVHQMKSAKKTDLINLHLVEYSTGMDTIKRLITGGYINETPDETDKRVKLLEITQTGIELLKQAEKRIADERTMFLACVSMNKWKKTLGILDEINEFHYSIYVNHNEKPYAELLNLMDSLKHLYK